MKKKFCNVFFILLLIGLSGSFYTAKKVNADAQKGTIKAKILNIRKGPGLSYPILLQGKKSDSFTLVQKKNDWYEVQLPDGQKGWVASWHVSLNDNRSSSALTTGTVTVNGLRVRSNPDLNSSILNTLQRNEVVSILSETGDWLQVMVNGIEGYVAKDYIDVDQALKKSPKQSKQLFGKVTVNQLNVRNKPSLNSAIVATVANGEVYEILEENSNWVKIKLKNNEYGWIAGWFLEKSLHSNDLTPNNSGSYNGEMVTILHNGTNLRSEPNTESKILSRGNEGDSFKAIEKKNDWYQIQLSDGTMAFVASWVVKSSTSSSDTNKAGTNQEGLNGKTIILDPGHGGRDSGTVGFIGTLEKNVTIRTAQLLSTKLKNAGANVIMTRKDDRYVPLPTRVSISQYNNSDAFISIHYDSINDQTVTGHTSYYYHSYQKSLAQDVHQGISNELNTKDRGVRFGDFHVLRENSQPSVLVELGYLSNPNQEASIKTNQYQESITTGIYDGLKEFFK